LLRPVGLPAEIVPLTDPLASEIFRVRVLFRGEPVAGALLNAWRRQLDRADAPRHPPREPVPAVAQARTDSGGVAALLLHGRGEWLVSAVHMVPSSDAGADWESYWASLTFARP
jgi:uncharacterized GH25 family protein